MEGMKMCDQNQLHITTTYSVGMIKLPNLCIPKTKSTYPITFSL